VGTALSADWMRPSRILSIPAGDVTSTGANGRVLASDSGVTRLLAPPAIVVIVAAMSVAGCTSQSDALDQHQEKLESLGASSAAITENWLRGAVSGTYAGTALEQIHLLVEQERSALASKPPALADPRGAHLSEAADRLSRLLAIMMQDVEHGDAAALREHASKIPILPQPQS
jgi:hypothetical protein